MYVILELDSLEWWTNFAFLWFTIYAKFMWEIDMYLTIFMSFFPAGWGRSFKAGAAKIK